MVELAGSPGSPGSSSNIRWTRRSKPPVGVQ